MIRGVALTTVVAALALGGCVERKLIITSEPSGARVWVNDLDVGRTPTEVGFRFHGDYDVRLELAGHEPLWTTRATDTPIYEYPPLDLIAEALPFKIENHQAWHFELEPSREVSESPEQFEAGLLERARELSAQLDGYAPTTETAAQPEPEPEPER